MRAPLAAAIAIAVLIGAVASANLIGDAASEGVPTVERYEVIALARSHWDNPVQRLTFWSFGVSSRARALPIGGSRCSDVLADMQSREWMVTAYTFFGVSLARALVTCDGSVTSLSP